MKFIINSYYHIYNRTNNEEPLFRSHENYLFFLKKYRIYLEDYFETIAYCLMPTHFHFLVRIKNVINVNSSDDNQKLDILISKGMQILQSSYTKAINKKNNRHGNLFQAHYSSKLIGDDSYLISLLTYIHQNPVRSKLVIKPYEWLYSSYQDYIDLRNGTLPSKELILNMIKKEELKELTERKLIQL